MFKLIKYLKPYKKEAIFGPLFKLFEAILELIIPLVMANIIDVGIGRLHSNSYVVWGGLVMIAIGVIGLMCALVCQYSGSKASQGVGTFLRRDLYAHINTLSHKEIESIGTSSLTTRLTNDINQVQVAVAMAIRLLTRAPFLVVGAAVMAMAIDLQLSLIFLIITPLVMWVLYAVMHKSVPLYKSIQKKLDKVSLIAGENIEGVRSIRAFAKSEYEEKRFDDASEDLKQTSQRVGRISALLNPATFLILNLAIIAIVWFGGIGVNDGRLTSGQIIAFVNYITQIMLALVVVANLVVIFTKSAASAARINEVFALEASVREGTSQLMMDFENENTPIIEFRNVCFSYHDRAEKSEEMEYVLRDVTFHVKKGEMLGIIGATGSGKTSVANLIPRFYDPQKGEILLFGANIKNFTFKSLRGVIGIVPQRAVLFAGTIASNLRLGKKDATNEEMMKALKIAQMGEFVSKLPKGLSTAVEQGGKNFSGGQCQRLAIARALVSQPRILILDDSTSALDFATEARLRKALSEENKGTTMIIISQRVSSIKNADSIVVLEDGTIAGKGRHSDLLQTSEIYREINSSQMERHRKKESDLQGGGER